MNTIRIADKAFTKQARNKCKANTYKARKRGIMFFDEQGEPFAFLVANRHGERFFVSCFNTCEGVRYMYALTSAATEKMGLAELSYREEKETAYKVWEDHQAALDAVAAA